MISSLDLLDDEARAVLQTCLARVGRTVDAEYRDDVLDDLRAYFAEHLEPGATADDVAALAATVGEAAESDAADDGRHARFGGIPIDLTPPTAERVAYTWWNPRDERIFVPRVFGLGWALNLGAVAVKLGLIEPDAEDEPFESTPAPAFRTALVVPVVLAGAVIAHYVVRGPTLPARLPNQLDVAGRVGSWTTKPVAAVTDIAAAVVPTAWAAWTIGRGATGARAAGSIATATASAGIAAGLTLWRAAALDGKPRPLAGIGLVALLWLPAGTLLLALARAGRAAEQRRDLGRAQ
jgi:Family of unknown function (DUF5808)